MDRTLLWYLVIVITFMGLGGAKSWVKVTKDGGNIHRWLFETWLFDCEPIRNIFYLPAAIFEIPRPWFIIKPPACIGPDVSIETYQLLLLFTIIISPWLKEGANRKGCQRIFTKLWPPPLPLPPSVRTCPHLVDPFPLCPCRHKLWIWYRIFQQNPTPSVHLHHPSP